jgi:hypothetical protein
MTAARFNGYWPYRIGKKQKKEKRKKFKEQLDLIESHPKSGIVFVPKTFMMTKLIDNMH